MTNRPPRPVCACSTRRNPIPSSSPTGPQPHVPGPHTYRPPTHSANPSRRYRASLYCHVDINASPNVAFSPRPQNTTGGAGDAVTAAPPLANDLQYAHGSTVALASDPGDAPPPTRGKMSSCSAAHRATERATCPSYVNAGVSIGGGFPQPPSKNEPPILYPTALAPDTVATTGIVAGSPCAADIGRAELPVARSHGCNAPRCVTAGGGAAHEVGVYVAAVADEQGRKGCSMSPSTPSASRTHDPMVM